VYLIIENKHNKIKIQNNNNNIKPWTGEGEKVNRTTKHQDQAPSPQQLFSSFLWADQWSFSTPVSQQLTQGHKYCYLKTPTGQKNKKIKNTPPDPSHFPNNSFMDCNCAWMWQYHNTYKATNWHQHLFLLTSHLTINYLFKSSPCIYI